MVILNDAPTVENCVKYARIFKRGYGNIEQIYRWAAVPRRDMSERRANDAFILQIKRVAKRLGRRAQESNVQWYLRKDQANLCF